MPRILFGLLLFVRLCSYELDEGILHTIKPFLIEENHPAKKALDKIFKENKFRILLNDASLEKAGFEPYGERHTSGIRVLVHKKLPDYVIKTYIDELTDKMDWLYLIARVEGRNAIQSVIDKRLCQKYFATPRKWIYKIESPYKPPSHLNEQHFILVVDLIEAYPHSKNRTKWKTKPTETILWHLYHILSESGAQDSNFVDNIPYCKDGRIAFIDTEVAHRWPINYSRLDHYLALPMRNYWHNLVHTNGSKK